MNYKKYLLIPSIALTITATAAIDFNASEVNTTSETVTMETTDKEYAPIHPTREQVEAAAATDLVTIPDANLEQALADELSVASGEITVGDIESLNILSAQDSEISDLTGLEYATGLTMLQLDRNEISDISPLAELNRLEWLGLGSNEITDISAIAGLTNLTQLDISSSNVTDISPIAGLTNLTQLNISSTNVTDISSLSGMAELTHFNAQNTPIRDLDGLANSTKMEVINMLNSEVSDISALENMEELTAIVFGHCNIEDLSPLSNKSKLMHLELMDNEIHDISPLATLNTENMGVVRLEDNHIADFSPLADYDNFIASNQTVVLDPITVASEDEIFTTLIDAYGNQQQLSLGIPKPGTHFKYAFYNGTTDDYKFQYNVMFIQKITFEESEISFIGNDKASSSEETILSDEDLIALFEVTNSDDLTITVDQSAVDYSTPGEYTVVFTDEDDNVFNATLTITDVLPVLTVDKDSITITKDSTIDDILSQLELSATEITEGDLTEVISYDDSAVDYSTPGDYTVVFTVIDEEGNDVSKTITVTIPKEDTNIEIDIDGSEVDNTVDVTDGDDITSDQTDTIEDTDTKENSDSESTDVEDDNTKMTIATTGEKTTILIMFISIVLAGLVYVKAKVSCKK